MIRNSLRALSARFDVWFRTWFMGDLPTVPTPPEVRSDFDAHVDDALALVSPWNDADRATAAALGVRL